MAEFIGLVFSISLFAAGIYQITKPGMILAVPDKWYDRLPHWISKPLFACIYCVCGVWGLALALVLTHAGVISLHPILWPVAAIAAVGVVFFFYEFIEVFDIEYIGRDDNDEDENRGQKPEQPMDPDLVEYYKTKFN